MWAVGERGNILHDDGKGWGRSESGTGQDLYAVWAAGKDDVFAVGDKGTIRHFDGQAWGGQRSGTERKLLSVFGSGGRDVWVAGDGVLLHYDGRGFSEVVIPGVTGLSPGSTNKLYGLWGTAPGDLWPDLADYCWAPTGDLVAYANYAGNELLVADRGGLAHCASGQ